MLVIIDAGNYDCYRIHFGLSLSRDYINSRPVLANIVTKSELATTNIFAFLISALSYAAKMVRLFGVSIHRIFQRHLLVLLFSDRIFVSHESEVLAIA